MDRKLYNQIKAGEASVVRCAQKAAEALGRGNDGSRGDADYAEARAAQSLARSFANRAALRRVQLAATIGTPKTRPGRRAGR